MTNVNVHSSRTQFTLPNLRHHFVSKGDCVETKFYTGQSAQGKEGVKKASEVFVKAKFVQFSFQGGSFVGSVEVPINSDLWPKLPDVREGG